MPRLLTQNLMMWDSCFAKHCALVMGDVSSGQDRDAQNLPLCNNGNLHGQMDIVNTSKLFPKHFLHSPVIDFIHGNCLRFLYAKGSWCSISASSWNNYDSSNHRKASSMERTWWTREGKSEKGILYSSYVTWHLRWMAQGLFWRSRTGSRQHSLVDIWGYPPEFQRRDVAYGAANDIRYEAFILACMETGNRVSLCSIINAPLKMLSRSIGFVAVIQIISTSISTYSGFNWMFKGFNTAKNAKTCPGIVRRRRWRACAVLARSEPVGSIQFKNNRRISLWKGGHRGGE